MATKKTTKKTVAKNTPIAKKKDYYVVYPATDFSCPLDGKIDEIFHASIKDAEAAIKYWADEYGNDRAFIIVKVVKAIKAETAFTDVAITTALARRKKDIFG